MLAHIEGNNKEDLHRINSNMKVDSIRMYTFRTELEQVSLRLRIPEFHYFCKYP